MKLALDPAQSMLAKTARDFSEKHRPLERQRTLRDTRDQLGYSPVVWSQMADLGWTGIPFAEEQGGLGMGLSEAALISEAMGAALAPEPFLSAVIFAGTLLSELGDDEQRESWLVPTIEGRKRLAVAHQDARTRFKPSHCSTVASRAEGSGTASNESWILNGHKAHVIDGYAADAWIVVARTSGEASDPEGLSMFIVPADRSGVTCSRSWRVDSRNAATLTLDDVEVSSSDLLGEVGSGLLPLQAAIDRATVALCAEMLGIAVKAFALTLEYLRTREQFGTKIGTFQALQHRAALVFVEIELCKSAVMVAARTLDDGESPRSERRAMVSNAKARCSDTVILVTNEALQMHGGVGMTDEYDIGLFMKRARVCELTFGDAAYHRDRFAQVRGF